MSTILIASDHAGFELKQKLIPFVRDMGYDVKDFGAHQFDGEDDYPDFIAPLAREISESGGTMTGIIIGGSGQGEAMVANRFPHVRAVVINDTNAEKVALAREHNDANVISLGARFMTDTEALEAVRLFLTTPFSEDERHVRRLKKLAEIKNSADNSYA